MEQCTTCETTFRSYAPLTLTTSRTAAGEVLVYAQNNGRNILVIQRMLVCLEYAGGSRSIFYVRDFAVGGDTLEQGSTQLKYRVTSPSAIGAQVEAEYREVTGRERSCYNRF